MENNHKSNSLNRKGRRYSDLYQTYLKRFVVFPSSFQQLPLADIYVVIPAFAETNLPQLFNSLAFAQPCKSEVCIVLVVNHPAHATSEEMELNAATIRFFESLNRADFWQKLYLIDARNEKAKSMGVGVARKIGMDAVIVASQNLDSNPSIICLDGDCTVHCHYFQVLDSGFHTTDYQVCTLPFRHPVSDLSMELRQGIEQYELFLEYNRLGLFWAGYPFYGHTVGSSMGVKAAAYALHGGMNQRKAGEDFYFLHKLFPHYPVFEPELELVYPSARISGRVPFGTGRFQSKWLETSRNGLYYSYNPTCFVRLKVFLDLVRIQLEAQTFDCALFQEFIQADKLQEKYMNENQLINELQRHFNSSNSPGQRKRSFFIWFDGLKALRFIHFFAEKEEAVSVREGIASICHWMDLDVSKSDNFHLVDAIRKLLHPGKSSVTG